MLESTLHNQLKNYYSQSVMMQENWVDGYQVDVYKEGLVIEIQTSNFYAIRPKLFELLKNHKVLLVYPVMTMKWIIRQDGERSSRRLSPRHGRLEDIFYELIRFPELVDHPNLTVEIVKIHAEEIRRNDGKGSWRRKGWSIIDRSLLEVQEQVQFFIPADFSALLPKTLISPFTVRQLANQAEISINLARKMVYCLQRMGELQANGKIGRASLYSLTDLD